LEKTLFRLHLAIDAIGKPDEVWFWIAEGAYLFRPIGQLKGAFTVARRLFTEHVYVE
jgi:hypothetical protein